MRPGFSFNSRSRTHTEFTSIAGRRQIKTTAKKQNKTRLHTLALFSFISHELIRYESSHGHKIEGANPKQIGNEHGRRETNKQGKRESRQEEADMEVGCKGHRRQEGTHKSRVTKYDCLGPETLFLSDRSMHTTHYPCPMDALSHSIPGRWSASATDSLERSVGFSRDAFLKAVDPQRQGGEAERRHKNATSFPVDEGCRPKPSIIWATAT